MIQLILNTIKSVPSGPSDLKDFGTAIGIITSIFGIYLIKQNDQFGIQFMYASLAFHMFAAAYPHVLLPLQKIWMTAAHLIAQLVTTLILMAIFYTILLPISVLLRFKGHDPLKVKLNVNTNSYWNNRSEKVDLKATFERQY